MRAASWDREHKSLFDYGSSTMNKKSFETNRESLLTRDGDDIQMQTDLNNSTA